MCSTKRLIVLTTALLGIEGAVGSALAGFYIEGDMDAAAAVLTVIISVLVTFAATVWGIVIASERAKKSGNQRVRALGHLIYGDLHSANPVDPDQVLYEIKDLLVKLVEKESRESAEKRGPLAGRPWEDTP